jgi:hypothetical protein
MAARPVPSALAEKWRAEMDFEIEDVKVLDDSDVVVVEDDCQKCQERCCQKIMGIMVHDCLK